MSHSISSHQEKDDEEKSNQVHHWQKKLKFIFQATSRGCNIAETCCVRQQYTVHNIHVSLL